jgi:hypothetical protein
MHVSFLVLNILGIVWYFSETFDIHSLIKYFSLQAFELALFYSFTSLFTSLKKSKLNQIFFELAFTSNVVTCLGYWSIVRGPAIEHITCNL